MLTKDKLPTRHYVSFVVYIDRQAYGDITITIPEESLFRFKDELYQYIIDLSLKYAYGNSRDLPSLAPRKSYPRNGTRKRGFNLGKKYKR